MKTTNEFGSFLGLLALLSLGACSTTNYPPNAPDASAAHPANDYAGYGVVQSVEVVRQEGGGIGLGTIAGAVVGGVVGNQVGAGRGNTAATIVGAAGGAYVGHELESRQQQNANAVRITVRMEDGAYRTVMQSTDGGLRVGDRVRVEGGTVQRY